MDRARSTHLTCRRRSLNMSFIEQFLLMLTDPNIAFLLLAIGVQAVLIEISSPGGWVAGFIGVVCLTLAIYGMGVLPVNWFGIIFMVTAFVLIHPGYQSADAWRAYRRGSGVLHHWRARVVQFAGHCLISNVYLFRWWWAWVFSSACYSLAFCSSPCAPCVCRSARGLRSSVGKTGTARTPWKEAADRSNWNLNCGARKQSRSLGNDQ